MPVAAFMRCSYACTLRHEECLLEKIAEARGAEAKRASKNPLEGMRAQIRSHATFLKKTTPDEPRL